MDFGEASKNSIHVSKIIFHPLSLNFAYMTTLVLNITLNILIYLNSYLCARLRVFLSPHLSSLPIITPFDHIQYNKFLANTSRNNVVSTEIQETITIDGFIIYYLITIGLKATVAIPK